jgi:zearalenone synthase (highly reducing iterative type I polyketide synthase)
MAFVAVTHGSTKAMKAMVPKFIDEVVITTDFPNEPRARISGCSTVSRHGYSEILADMTMQEDVWGQPVLKISGLCCAELAGAQVDESLAEAGRSICSKLVWRPALELLRQEELKSFLQQAVTADNTGTATPTAMVLSEVSHYPSSKQRQC